RRLRRRPTSRSKLPASPYPRAARATRMPDPYGLRRVVRPAGVLPQQADALDPAMPLGDDELLIDVEHLNIDAASFRQLEEAAKGDPRRIAGLVAEIVRGRGKMHNPRSEERRVGKECRSRGGGDDDRKI